VDGTVYVVAPVVVNVFCGTKLDVFDVPDDVKMLDVYPSEIDDTGLNRKLEFAIPI
jgi:hypothetical protein